MVASDGILQYRVDQSQGTKTKITSQTYPVHTKLNCFLIPSLPTNNFCIATHATFLTMKCVNSYTVVVRQTFRLCHVTCMAHVLIPTFRQIADTSKLKKKYCPANKMCNRCVIYKYVRPCIAPLFHSTIAHNYIPPHKTRRLFEDPRRVS